MKFVTIDAYKAKVETVEAASPQEAYAHVGLNPGSVDHGVVHPGVAIVVYEYFLFVPVDEQRWFAVGRQLFGGTAVLYGFDESGETVDLKEPPPVLFFRDYVEVERAIQNGVIDRPRMAVNNQVLWQWPQQR